MDLPPPPRRPRGESIVPMINVVFLLLVFFLMTATIAPPDPFDVTPPESSAGSEPDLDQPLHVAADGRLVWGELRGPRVVQAIADARAEAPTPKPLAIRADRDVAATRIARLLAELARAGVTESQLIAEPSG